MDYLTWRGDLLFSERSFNEVDNVILSELAYFDYGEASGGTVTVARALADHDGIPAPHGYPMNDPMPLLRACAASPRFRDVAVSDYESILDKARQIQFSAVTFTLPTGEIYVAFRGTDNTIVGWREDFNASFMEQTPAQAEAVAYLDRALAKHPGTLLVGGHSKGGNLAVYSAAFCKAPERIAAVYSNDGPGFNQYVTESPEFSAVQSKVRLILPEFSLIGLLLSNVSEKTVVQSTASGAMQHDTYTWVTERDHFVRAKQTGASVLLDRTLDRWIDSLDREQREQFVSVLFDLLEASGADTVEQLHKSSWSAYQAIFKAAGSLDESTRAGLLESLKKLASSGASTVKQEGKKLASAGKTATVEELRQLADMIFHRSEDTV